jgi:Domain of unknown function (DUF4372)
MKVCSIFSQVLKLFSRGGFEKAVKQHKAEHHARGFTSWGQFVAMLFCQVGRAHSLREICGGLACCEGQLKHLGVPVAPKRSTLAYANEHRPWELYQTVFEQTLSQCQELVRRQGGRKKFRFKNKLMSLDGSIIDLSVSMFDWAKFRRTKGAIKLHLLLDHDGYLPSFAVVTEGKTSEIKVAQAAVRARHDPGDRPWIHRLRVVSGTDAGGSVLRNADEGEGGLRGPGGIANSAKQQRGARSDHLLSPTGTGGRRAGAIPAGRDLGHGERGGHRVPLEPVGLRGDDHRGHLQGPLGSGIVFQGAQAAVQDQDFCGDQRQRGPNPGVDGVDRDAGAEVPAVEIVVLLVLIDAVSSAAAATVLLSRSVGVVG